MQISLIISIVLNVLLIIIICRMMATKKTAASLLWGIQCYIEEHLNLKTMVDGVGQERLLSSITYVLKILKSPYPRDYPRNFKKNNTHKHPRFKQ